MSVSGKSSGSCPALLQQKQLQKWVHQPCFSRMRIQVWPEIFMLHKLGEMETEFPVCPTWQLLSCSLCCMRGATLALGAKGWCQMECKVNVQSFGIQMWKRLCCSKWMVCLEMVCVYFIVLPAGISHSLCFVNIMCLVPLVVMVPSVGRGFGVCWFVWFFVPSPSHALTPTGKPRSLWAAFFQTKDLFTSIASSSGKKREVLVTALCRALNKKPESEALN